MNEYCQMLVALVPPYVLSEFAKDIIHTSLFSLLQFGLLILPENPQWGATPTPVSLHASTP
jgi:hypothetical protein